MKSFFPITTWLPHYNRSMLRGDMSAGITVGILLIPQGMAYAMIAGLPPVYGLYASLVPLLIYGIMGTSRQLAVGPVALVSLLVAAGVSEFAEPGTSSYIQLAVLLALMTGGFQLLIGLFRLGFLVNFLSHPVVTGFTAAAALIIALSQVHHILGISVNSTLKVHEVLIQLFESLGDVNVQTLLVGFLAIVLVAGLRMWNRHLPGALIAVVVSILLILITGWDQKGVAIIGDIPSGLPAFGMPDFDMEVFSGLFPMAVAISLIGFMESMAVAKMVRSRHRDYKLDTDQELVAIGAANIGGALFQSYPVTGGFARTAINDQSGAKTGMSSIISAVLIGLTLLFLTPLFYYLPGAVLGAIVITAVLGLIDISEIRFLWRTRREDFMMMAVTFFVTLLIGLKEGLLIGVILSLVVVIYRSSTPHVAILGRLPESRIYRNIVRYPEAIEQDDVVVVRYDAPLYFANSEHFKGTIEELVNDKGEKLQLVVLDASGINLIDTTGLHALTEMNRQLQSRGVTLCLASVRGPVRDVLRVSGYFDSNTSHSCYLDVQDAIDAFNHPESSGHGMERH
ncbi:MAG: solute carrier family 26 protein [Balneolales bacterium]